MSDSGGRSWAYDGRGNEATQTATGANYTYTFDWRNQLASITGSATASYIYDPWGRRSSKTVSGTKTNYIYAGQGLVQEKNASLAVNADYLFGPGIDQPIAMKRGGSVYYYVVDGLGSVRLVTNTSNAVQNKYQWDAWGVRASTGADPVVNPFGYTGREMGDAQDHFYRARYYNPGLARFLSEDPHVSTLATSPYAYTANDPIGYIDPYGLWKIPPGRPTPPPPWQLDPTHKGGKLWRAGDDELEFHEGKPGEGSNQGRDHWHYRPGGKRRGDHLYPGDRIPDPVVPDDADTETEQTGDEDTNQHKYCWRPEPVPYRDFTPLTPFPILSNRCH